MYFFSFATLSWCSLSTMYPQQPSLNLTLLSIVILFGLPFLSIFYFIFIQSKFFFPNLVIMKYFCNQMINFCGVKIIFESNLWGSWTAQNPMEVHWQLSSTLKSGGFLSVFPFQFFFLLHGLLSYSAKDYLKNYWRGPFYLLLLN